MNRFILSQELRDQITKDIKHLFSNSEGSHDWWHIHRVVQMAEKIRLNTHEGDELIIFLAAILHDVTDPKLNIRSHEWVIDYLRQKHITENVINQVLYITENISFSKSKNSTSSTTKSIEFQIVQDADRLDAIGAIGIARTFAYGGKKHRPIYTPKDSNSSINDGKGEASIDHFYEKLLTLEELMNTPFAKIMARERTRYMEEFLERFNNEWNINIE
ncbi:MAG: HD domain-containing protein [Prolixibacteraceae bacterium]|jgi:uncharacterized protein|nr:HD domain-containing protein [Prolixibacteraceae bacterium]